MSRADVIAAIATAPGRGAVGIVRISGRDLSDYMAPLFGCSIPPRAANYTAFLSGSGTPIDSGIALYFPSPRSYTGEDVIELQGHGGTAITKAVLARCVELGARIAEPGEFTLRAYLNGKIDLAQAEAIADLIDAQTEAAARAANRTLQGVFSQSVKTLEEKLLSLRSQLEAELNFPEDPVGVVNYVQLREGLVSVIKSVESLLVRANRGRLLRAGARVVIVGAPNVGKSSLLNRLAGDAIAIVTEVPGTTRDIVSVDISIDGIPVTLLDTAGLRPSDDIVERIGIDRAREEAGKADLLLVVDDASDPQWPESNDVVGKDQIQIRVYNKIDLLTQKLRCQSDAIYLSARTGAGIEELRGAILRKIQGDYWTGDDIIARERHIVALEGALQHLRNVAVGMVPVAELIAEELRLAEASLGAIVGHATPDDLLGAIFSKFCIGK